MADAHSPNAGETTPQRTIGTACAWLCVLAGPAAAAQTPVDEAREAFARDHEAMRDRTDLQFAFEEQIEPPPPEWMEAVGRVLADFFTAISPALEILFWIVVAAAALAFVAFIGREILRSRFPERFQRKRRGPIIQDEQPDPMLARSLLADADALAAQGRYAEAARALLHRSIDDIQNRQDAAIRRDWTSREIAAWPQLSPLAREVFIAIATIVERAWFAGRVLTAEDFATARAAYARFTEPVADGPSWAGAQP